MIGISRNASLDECMTEVQQIEDILYRRAKGERLAKQIKQASSTNAEISPYKRYNEDYTRRATTWSNKEESSNNYTRKAKNHQVNEVTTSRNQTTIKPKMTQQLESYGDYCYRCGGYGHWAKYCPTEFGTYQQERSKPNPKKHQRSTGRTDQFCSYVNKSVQSSAQTNSIQIFQKNPLSVYGTIAKQPTKMLIDSGASLTLIDLDLFYQLPYYIRQHVRFPPPNFQMHLADKSCLQVQRTLLLPITIADRTRKHIVYVVPKLWGPCIIGNDFIQKHNLQIDGGRQRVYFKDLVVENLMTSNSDPVREKDEQYVLLASERFKIPSYHAVEIQVYPNKEFVNIDEKPSEYEITSMKLTPCVANGLIKPQKSMNVQVANLTKKTIIIHPGQALASMTRLNEAQSNVLHQLEKTQQGETSNNCTTENELDLSNINLTQQQRSQLKKLIRSFSDIFRKQNGRTKMLRHQIKLIPDSKPFNSPPYRYAPAKRQVIEQNLKEMKEEEIIEPSKSPWASPVVLAPK